MKKILHFAAGICSGLLAFSFFAGTGFAAPELQSSIPSFRDQQKAAQDTSPLVIVNDSNLAFAMSVSPAHLSAHEPVPVYLIFGSPDKDIKSVSLSFTSPGTAKEKNLDVVIGKPFQILAESDFSTDASVTRMFFDVQMKDGSHRTIVADLHIGQ